MQHSTDPKGRLFIDRDPELFAVLLQFLRAYRRRAIEAACSTPQIQKAASLLTEIQNYLQCCWVQVNAPSRIGSNVSDCR